MLYIMFGGTAPVEIFVDESRQKGYVLVAAVVSADELARSRKIMRSLKPRNRDRIHMHAEGRASREKIAAEFIRRRPISKAVVLTAPIHGRPERRVRTALLRELARLASELGATRILIESCSQDKEDRTAMVGVLASLGKHDSIRVAFDNPHGHELLWAADVVAWAFTNGWRPKLAAAGLLDIVTLE